MIRTMDTAYKGYRFNRDLMNPTGLAQRSPLIRRTDNLRRSDTFLNFRLIHQRHVRKMVFIAVEEGIDPMLGMLRYLQETHDHRPAFVFCAGGATENAAFLEELDQMPRRIKSTQLEKANAQDWSECITSQLMKTCGSDFLAGAHVFLCGPEPIAEQVRLTLLKLGVKQRRIYLECCEPKSKARHAE